LVPNTLAMGMESRLALLAGARVAVTTATTPLAIAFEFEPAARQIRVPDPEPQLRDLPAAVRAGPAVAPRVKTSAGG